MTNPAEASRSGKRVVCLIVLAAAIGIIVGSDTTLKVVSGVLTR